MYVFMEKGRRGFLSCVYIFDGNRNPESKTLTGSKINGEMGNFAYLKLTQSDKLIFVFLSGALIHYLNRISQ